MTFNIRNVCFLCSEDFLEDDHSVHNSTENIRGPCSRFHEENAFVICHILEIPHWQSVTTRSKFQDTLFCHQCMDKIKEIRCLLQDLAELEQMVLNRKVEVETQLRQSWEKRRNMNIDDPVDHFRNEIVTELSSTKLLSTLTKVRENRIGRRFSSSSKEIPKSEEAEAKFISSSVAEAYLPQREATMRTRNRFLTTTVPTTDTVEEETEDSNPRRVTELIFSDGQGSSGLPRYIPINEGRMETEITENIVGSSITNEFQDVEEPEFVNTSSEYGYAAEVCDVKYDPLSSEYEEQITSGTDHPSASNSVTVTDGPNIYVHESELHLPSNIQFTTGTGSANKGISSVGYTSYRELKQPYKPESEYPRTTKPKRAKNNWELSTVLENKTLADALVLDTWCSKDTKSFLVGVTKYYYCKVGGPRCPSGLKLVFYANSEKVGVHTNGQEHVHGNDKSFLPVKTRKTLEYLYKTGLTEQTELLDGIREYDVAIPTKEQIIYFIQSYQRKFHNYEGTSSS